MSEILAIKEQTDKDDTSLTMEEVADIQRQKLLARMCRDEGCPPAPSVPLPSAFTYLDGPPPMQKPSRPVSFLGRIAALLQK